MGPPEGALGDLDFWDVEIRTSELIRNMCGEYKGTLDGLREVLDSDVGDEDFEEYIYFFQISLSNSLHPHEVFCYLFGFF